MFGGWGWGGVLAHEHGLMLCFFHVKLMFICEILLETCISDCGLYVSSPEATGRGERGTETGYV